MNTKKFFVASLVDGIFTLQYDANHNPYIENWPVAMPDFDTEIEIFGKERINSVMKYSELYEKYIVTRMTGFEYNNMFYIPVPGLLRGPEPMGSFGAFAVT